jgi:hypothetical protein
MSDSTLVKASCSDFESLFFANDFLGIHFFSPKVVARLMTEMEAKMETGLGKAKASQRSLEVEIETGQGDMKAKI